MLLLFWLSVLAATEASKVNGTHGYCSSNTFVSNSSWMHLTKEHIPLEYAYQDKFKSIHCCVKGYRSIEWFKDGIAYPWSAGVSNLILYPEAANQTLYTRKAARADSGNYTCRLSNETHVETHTLRLDVLEKSTDAPRIMFISTDKWAEEGENLRLYCEALIGQSYLADARSDLGWRKVWPNGSEGDLLPSQVEIKTTREDEEDIIGSYLNMEHVSALDYGTYVCVVHSNDVVSKHYVTVHYKSGGTLDLSSISPSIPWRALALGLSALALVLLTVLALRRRCVPSILLAARQARARAASSAARARVLEKEFDVLLCWTSVDAELVRGALLPTLAIKYKYRVQGVELPTQPDTWYEELVELCGRCRSVAVVVSPAQYSRSQLLLLLRQVRALPLPPALILLQDLPKLKREAKESGESLVALLRGTRLIPWRHVHEWDFWTTLRLALPLPPPQIKTAEPGDKNSRSGSMTALV